MNGVVRVYTDGSYKDGHVAYGFSIYGVGFFGETYVFASKATTALQNVEAELKAVLQALLFLKSRFGKLEKTPVLICYDLDAVRNILRNPEAQARNEFFRKYATRVELLQKSLECQLLFEKVRGHHHELHNKLDRAVRRKVNEVLAVEVC